MFSTLVGSDPKQITRLLRHITAMVFFVLFCVITFYFFSRGLFSISREQFELMMVVFWAGMFCFTALIRSGVNKRFSDPSLTMAQMIWGTTFVMAITYSLDEWRGLTLMAYFGLLSFGYFKLSFREFVAVSMYAILGYFLMILYMFIVEPERLNTHLELLQLLAFTATIVVMLYTGSAIYKLRERSKKQHVELQEALDINKKLATTDELTGLYNRRYFMEKMQRQKALCERDQSDFVICFCDLDNFKHINDTFGHHTGDLVLQKFSEILQSSIREVDFAARFGGEEFVCLLVNTDIERAEKVTERIRSGLENYNFSDIAPSLKATVSIGYSNFKQFSTIQETLMSADNRMYLAKKLGRNRVVSTDDELSDASSSIPAR